MINEKELSQVSVKNDLISRFCVYTKEKRISYRLYPNTKLFSYRSDVVEIGQNLMTTEYFMCNSVKDMYSEIKPKKGRVESNYTNRYLDFLDKKGCNSFYFVIRTKSFSEIDVPDGVGVIIDNGKGFKKIKKSPIVHHKRITPIKAKMIDNQMYYKFHEYTRLLVKENILKEFI